MSFFDYRPKRTNKSVEVCSTDQNLGQRVRSVDVQCTFKARESRWATKDETELYGLLLFNIQFTDHDSTPLKTAIITIDVGANDSDKPLFVIDETAPANGITGAPIKQPIRKTKAIDPDIELGAAGTNVKASGFSSEEETEVTDVHRWTFKAGLPSQKRQTRIQKADFTWTRTLLQDRSGTRRSYEGVLIVNSSKTCKTPLELDVRVEVKPWHRYHSFLRGSSKHRRSDPIGPPKKTLASSEPLLPVGYKDLEHYVIARNSRLAPTRKSKSHLLLLRTLTTYIY